MTLRVKTYTQDGSIEKVTEAQECNRLSEQDVTVLRERWGYNEMEEKKRNKCFQFLKHLWRPMPIMIWLAILIEALQFDWMDFAVLCALQAMDGLFGWYEESKASDAIEASRNLVPRHLVKLNSMD